MQCWVQRVSKELPALRKGVSKAHGRPQLQYTDAERCMDPHRKGRASVICHLELSFYSGCVVKNCICMYGVVCVITVSVSACGLLPVLLGNTNFYNPLVLGSVLSIYSQSRIPVSNRGWGPTTIASIVAPLPLH